MVSTLLADAQSAWERRQTAWGREEKAATAQDRVEGLDGTDTDMDSVELGDLNVLLIEEKTRSAVPMIQPGMSRIIML